MRPRLIYVQDTFCSWCYGFAPVVDHVAATWGDRLDIDVYAGGMLRGSRVRPVREAAEAMRSAVPKVVAATGASFGAPYLDVFLTDGTAVLDSTIPSRMLQWVKQQHPEKALSFAHRLQRAVFLDGLDLSRAESYHHLATEAGFDATAAVGALEHPELHVQTEQEFAAVADAGIDGFPTMMYVHGDVVELLCEGYRSAVDIDHMLQTLVGADGR